MALVRRGRKIMIYLNHVGKWHERKNIAGYI